MFTIEFVTVRAGQAVDVVQRLPTGQASVEDVEKTARVLLQGVRARRLGAFPDGFQILDSNGRVVVRSWEHQP